MDRTYEYKKVTGRVMNVYRIRIYDGHPKGGWYRQLTSLSAFASNILDYWYNTIMIKPNAPTIFGRCDSCDKEGWLRINHILPDTEQYSIEYKDFDSVWDFYNYIGYDYKNKSKKQLNYLIKNWRD